MSKEQSQKQSQNNPIFPRITQGCPVNELVEIYIESGRYFMSLINDDDEEEVISISLETNWERLLLNFIEWCRKCGFEMTYKK